MLQWSHVLTNVETRQHRYWYLRPDDASMEPRPHERGNYYGKDEEQAVQKCFNGATSSRTWKLLRQGRGAGRTEVLQWSHVLTNVETNGCGPPPDCRGLLQWSHVLTNVETPPSPAAGGRSEEH